MPDTATTAAMTKPQVRGERARTRRSVLWPARLVISGRGDVRCFVTDVADGGARLRAETPLPVGTLVKFRSSRLVRTACVVWSGDGFIGLRFTEAVPAVAKAFDSDQG